MEKSMINPYVDLLLCDFVGADLADKHFYFVKKELQHVFHPLPKSKGVELYRKRCATLRRKVNHKIKACAKL